LGVAWARQVKKRRHVTCLVIIVAERPAHTPFPVRREAGDRENSNTRNND
jgi:hypothetical protein